MMNISNHRNELRIPSILYGTAWKEEQTESLTKVAIKSGFTGIDTANQRRHYFEEAVGKAIQEILKEGRLERTDLFLQTKYTYSSSQDARIPYNVAEDFTTQVNQSFQSSLEHLGTNYIDSYVLHGPFSHQGLTEVDKEVWRAMEALQNSGVVRMLGVSNVNFEQLTLLLEFSEIKPAFVQNRCYAKTRWDFQIRELCYRHNLIYQGFSLLTANHKEVVHPELTKMSKRLKCSNEQVIFRFALQTGMIALTGTSNRQHMVEDLSIDAFELTDDEIYFIENIAF